MNFAWALNALKLGSIISGYRSYLDFDNQVRLNEALKSGQLNR